MDFTGAGDGRERALALLLLSMADDEFVIGFSDSEWTGIGPILEEDVAISSLAQDELGHAQALYGLFVDVVADGRDADAVAYDRPPEGYLHARLLDHPRGDWAADDRPALALRDGRRGASGGPRGLEPRAAPRARRASSAARSATTGCTSTRGWSGSREAGGEPRQRLRRGPGRARAGRRHRAGAAPRGDGARPARDPRRAVGRDRGRWRAETSTTLSASGSTRCRRPAIRARARTRHSDAFRALHAEFTMVRRLGGRRDVVTAGRALPSGSCPAPAATSRCVRATLRRRPRPRDPDRLDRRPRAGPRRGGDRRSASGSSSCRPSSPARRSRSSARRSPTRSPASAARSRSRSRSPSPGRRSG